MPILAQDVEWERAELEFINDRPILQLWLWDGGVGEANVQSMNWFVYEMKDRKATLLARGVVRKRRRVGEGDESRFVYDAWQKHYLKAAAEGRLEWSLGSKTLILEKDANGIQTP